MSFDFDAGKQKRCNTDVGIVDEIGSEGRAGGGSKDGIPESL